jgi:hypothetical protein
MKVQQAMLVALVAAVAVTTVAAADSDAAKQRVAITTQANRTTTVSKAVLTPLQAGALESDSGSLVGESQPSHKVVMRDGQIVEIYGSVASFKGKRGRIVMRIRQEYIEAGNGYHPATGTWKVVRGTGDYEGVTGGGRFGHVWLEWNDHWSSRLEGFLTVR